MRGSNPIFSRVKAPSSILRSSPRFPRNPDPRHDKGLLGHLELCKKGWDVGERINWLIALMSSRFRKGCKIRFKIMRSFLWMGLKIPAASERDDGK